MFRGPSRNLEAVETDALAVYLPGSGVLLSLKAVVPFLVLEERESEQAERTALSRKERMLRERVQSLKRDLTTETAAAQPMSGTTHATNQEDIEARGPPLLPLKLDELLTLYPIVKVPPGSLSAGTNSSGTAAKTVEAWLRRGKDHETRAQDCHMAGSPPQASAESASQLSGAHLGLATSADHEIGVNAGLNRREDPSKNDSPGDGGSQAQEETSLQTWSQTALDLCPTDGFRRAVGGEPKRSKAHIGDASTAESQSADQPLPSDQKGGLQATMCSKHWGLASPGAVEQVKQVSAGGQSYARALAPKSDAERPRGAHKQRALMTQRSRIRKTKTDESARLIGTWLENSAPGGGPRLRGELTGGSATRGVDEETGGQSARHALRNRGKRPRREGAQSALEGTASSPIAVSSDDDVPDRKRHAKGESSVPPVPTSRGTGKTLPGDNLGIPSPKEGLQDSVLACSVEPFGESGGSAGRDGGRSGTGWKMESDGSGMGGRFSKGKLPFDADALLDGTLDGIV
ncbi:hypothetical protein KFL_001240280 [Klebsormidium nitens]|uniref:Uncharacterized protein n=1 Tax=Klebsormidium nitens TaxID=105231 RepID=A0A1Y1I223_KLENI|nr:hypothetical protein KFL_001240280 [Klebsormidium nitens]|eukprot:GAQ82797.1 hypothetical protein KFL_001240280 [Klebsormidium nitens]